MLADTSLPHIAVCICTYQRPELLQRLLEGVASQATDNRFTVSVVVCDNDGSRSAEAVVQQFEREGKLPATYCVEPTKNIALARNQALAHATGEYVAFIDDDEHPAANWLSMLWQCCETYKVAGVLGPVRPHFEADPPAWLIRGRFCERPEHETGRVMPWDESRTGNFIFRRAILEDEATPFHEEFGTGGEDKDFFMRMNQRGYGFVWCNEAVAYETVPPARWKRSYMLRRALLRGRNILKHPEGRAGVIFKSIVAVPIYCVVLPFTLLFGQHCFMKYCVRFCDHFGRLLALIGANTLKRPV